MANLTVTLYIRIKTEDGKKPFCKPVYLAKGRLKPLYAIVNGEPEYRPEGVYYMRFGADSGKPMVPLGTDPIWHWIKSPNKSVGCGIGNAA
jgi:hypothetical protein